MSLLHVASNKGSNKIIVPVGWELNGIKSVKLLRYAIHGIPLAVTDICYYLKIHDLDVQTIWAGKEFPDLPLNPLPNTNNRYTDPLNTAVTLTSYWPLYLNRHSFLNTSVFVDLNFPVEMCGRNGWGSNKKIILEIVDSQNNPAIFTEIAFDFYISKENENLYPLNIKYNTDNITPNTMLYQSIMQ